MGEGDDRLYWIEPRKRGILPLNEFTIPRSLGRKIRREPYDIRVNYDFEATLQGCAERDETWINASIRHLYTELYETGFAHSVEAWDEQGLAGGLYGVSMGGAFFGESMFTRRADASKIALVYLAARLKEGGYTLLDTQFVTDHLQKFGAMEISREAYREELAEAMALKGDFFCLQENKTPSEILKIALSGS